MASERHGAWRGGRAPDPSRRPRATHDDRAQTRTDMVHVRLRQRGRGGTRAARMDAATTPLPRRGARRREGARGGGGRGARGRAALRQRRERARERDPTSPMPPPGPDRARARARGELGAFERLVGLRTRSASGSGSPANRSDLGSHARAGPRLAASASASARRIMSDRTRAARARRRPQERGRDAIARRGLCVAAVACAASITIAVSAPQAAARPVAVSLEAAWAGTPFLHEAAEALVRDDGARDGGRENARGPQRCARWSAGGACALRETGRPCRGGAIVGIACRPELLFLHARLPLPVRAVLALRASPPHLPFAPAPFPIPHSPPHLVL